VVAEVLISTPIATQGTVRRTAQASAQRSAQDVDGALRHALNLVEHARVQRTAHANHLAELKQRSITFDRCEMGGGGKEDHK